MTDANLSTNSPFDVSGEGPGVMFPIEGGILAAEGFRAAAVNSGIKPTGLDLVLIVSDRRAAAAATVTQNRFRAAPTYVTLEAVADGYAQAIICNSGNANAATGEEGLRNAREMARLTAEAAGVDASDVIVCSTGHIGDQLPIDKIATGVKAAAPLLSRGNADIAARGIMTTDTQPKSVAASFDVQGTTCRIGAICKGAGMIEPNMATMLCFIASDVAIEPGVLREALRDAVKLSFNCITVDGDMSTNDTVAILANGAAGNAPITCAGDAGYEAFRAALGYCTQDLAKKIAADGEGASKFITINVTGAATYEVAYAMGKAVANYNLVKTAVYGQDFNWGRIAAAMGSSLLDFDPAQASIAIQGILAWDRGTAVDLDLAAARKRLHEHDVTIDIDLGSGREGATIWTCDFTPEYVRFNAEYDVAALAGEED
jgi:glutamate N-acetyltransferase/amino-acid N-acetyltransferase